MDGCARRRGHHGIRTERASLEPSVCGVTVQSNPYIPLRPSGAGSLGRILLRTVGAVSFRWQHCFALSERGPHKLTSLEAYRAVSTYYTTSLRVLQSRVRSCATAPTVPERGSAKIAPRSKGVELGKGRARRAHWGPPSSAAAARLRFFGAKRSISVLVISVLVPS